MSRSDRLYASLMRAYPRSFRERYADEMVVLFRDKLRDAGTERGTEGVIATWIRGLGDLAINAIGQHLRRDRTVAHSVATFQPTLPMRLLGALGVSGALVLLVPFLAFEPFEDFHVNLLRLAWFSAAGSAIALAYYPRLAVARPSLRIRRNRRTWGVRRPLGGGACGLARCLGWLCRPHRCAIPVGNRTAVHRGRDLRRHPAPGRRGVGRYG